MVAPVRYFIERNRFGAKHLAAPIICFDPSQLDIHRLALRDNRSFCRRNYFTIAALAEDTQRSDEVIHTRTTYLSNSCGLRVAVRLNSKRPRPQPMSKPETRKFWLILVLSFAL